MVTETVDPRNPDTGVNDVTIGGVSTIENSWVFVGPAALVTVIVGVPRDAAEEMMKFAVSEAPSALIVTFENVKPVQVVESCAPWRFVPLIVTEMVVPGLPLDGVIELIVGGVTGGGPTWTVKSLSTVAGGPHPPEALR